MEKDTAESVAKEFRPQAEESDVEEICVEENDSNASKHGTDYQYDYQCLFENTIAEERTTRYRQHLDRGSLSRELYQPSIYNVSVQQLLFKHLQVRQDLRVVRQCSF